MFSVHRGRGTAGEERSVGFRPKFDGQRPARQDLIRGQPGSVESGCKCVVQHRLDLSGMHWSQQGAEALLPIGALYKSGRLDEFHNWRVRDLKQVASLSA